jgi:CubicO group peptidase (beta-lactamase class C family)
MGVYPFLFNSRLYCIIHSIIFALSQPGKHPSMNYRLGVLLIAISIFSCKQKPAPQKKAVTLLKGEFGFRKLADTERLNYGNEVENMYNRVLKANHFNGGVIVAKNGEVVFEKYEGFSNFSTKETITANTTFHIASISKTFTSAAILRLWEQQKLSLDDSVQKFFPAFPYHNISIKQLLTHRSGLPKYEYFMDTAWHENRMASNDDMLQFMISKQPDLYAQPNKHYQYCNTNFALLALVVEKVTGQPFPEYMKDSLFLPLGMNSSFVFSTKDTLNYTPSYMYNNSPFKLEPLDCIYGDKNVYSTPRDLLLWDKALYGGAFISKQTLKMAFEPYSTERRSVHNYGMGWHLFMGKEEDRVVYHNGWWHGNNASFVRLVKDTATIIVLGNRYNRAVYWSGRMGIVFSAGKNKDRQLEE